MGQYLVTLSSWKHKLRIIHSLPLFSLSLSLSCRQLFLSLFVSVINSRLFLVEFLCLVRFYSFSALSSLLCIRLFSYWLGSRWADFQKEFVFRIPLDSCQYGNLYVFPVPSPILKSHVKHHTHSFSSSGSRISSLYQLNLSFWALKLTTLDKSLNPLWELCLCQIFKQYYLHVHSRCRHFLWSLIFFFVLSN